MVTGIWFGYNLEESETENPRLTIKDVSAHITNVDDRLWAQYLSMLNVGYLIIDKSVIEGQEPGPSFSDDFRGSIQAQEIQLHYP